MIPVLKREHVDRVLQRIDAEGVSHGRNSRKFSLLANGRRYPPKYVLSLAFYYASGRELRPDEFGGGRETNSCLQALGYVIEDQTTCRPPGVSRIKRIARGSSQFGGQHDERCPFCKNTVIQMLQVIYGGVERNYRLEAATLPEHYENSPWHAELLAIFEALASHRGFGKFVKTSNLPNCDFYVPNPGFIVEFDESQHFTECRKLTLAKYPNKLNVGYDRERWISLCESLNARDNDPPYRDEQRAWYDTLRDFLPSIKGFRPTIRLYSRDTQWCSLSPTSQRDVEYFRTKLQCPGALAQPWNIEINGDPQPIIGRIIIEGPWSGEAEFAQKLLEQIAGIWPRGQQVTFLMTPGAFITFGRPADLPRVGDNVNPDPQVVDLLFREARARCEAILTERLIGHLKGCTRYLTLGVDSKKQRISQTQKYINEPHVEMVCLVDLQSGKYYVTGKSYPTPQQQRRLLRIPDLQSHFLDLDCGTVMVLGCHDLTIFNPRGQARATGWRSAVSDEFRRIAEARKPGIVLHHPHTTIKTTTWLHAWNGLRRDLPSVHTYAGTGRYSSDDAGWARRHPLREVLNMTTSGPTLDLIVKT